MLPAIVLGKKICQETTDLTIYTLAFSEPTGLEPVRHDVNRFLVDRLNHSATAPYHVMLVSTHYIQQTPCTAAKVEGG